MGTSCRFWITTAVAFAFFASCIHLVELTGSFEIRLHRYAEEEGCCGRSTAAATAAAVSFRICVKNYQAFFSSDSPCIIGEAVTAPYRAERFHSLEETISFPFNFTWPGSFSFVIEAYRDSEGNGQRMPITFFAQRDLSANREWHEEHLSKSNRTLLVVSYRVKCENNYYGDRCDTFCKPRDDTFGHYTCDAREGRKVCRPGWKDEYCNTVICRTGCHEIHGYCKQPYECVCRPGWEGKFCDICLRYPGCQHGTCVEPWQCNCNEGWGGLFCSEDLNYCTNHRPCMNGGTCTNTGQGSYTCSCSEDFMGKNCDILKNPCTNNPCQNGGTCVNPSEGNYTCRCVLGFYGQNCKTSASICTHNPCQNGGSCVHHPDGYVCECAPGYFGTHCEKIASTCVLGFCRNNGTCVQRIGSLPKCHCLLGFTGNRCETGVSCTSIMCSNGGTCITDSPIRCLCPTGFSGATCELKHDYCSPNPCLNGGTCRDLTTNYLCDCIAGFAGKNCSMSDLCTSSPCRNGGTCRSDSSRISCHCALGYQGRLCERGSPHLDLQTTFSNAISNVSHQVSDDPRSNGDSKLVIILASSLVGLAAFVTCAICLGIKGCQLHRRKLEKRAHVADEDEVKQNERNTLQMNNKYGVVTPQNKIVNTLDRMAAKVNNDNAAKVVNAQVGNLLPEKNILYMQRTLERRDKRCGSSNSISHHSTQEWSPRNSVFIIQDHIQPLKSDDLYPTQHPPPLLHLVDNEKVFATEV